MSRSAPASRISIGLPVRNGEKWLGDAIRSALAQTLYDFELIISDNASTDGSLAMAEAFAAQDARICVVRNETNRGAAWNFAETLRRARAPYFKWLAADDTIAPTFFERTAAVLDAEPDAVLVYPQSVNLHFPDEYLYDYRDVMPLPQVSAVERFAEHRRRAATDPALLEGSHPFSNAIHGLVRTEVLRATAGLAPHVGSDLVLLGELGLHGKIVEIPEQLMAMRQNGGSPWAHDGTSYDVALWLDPRNAARVASYAPTWALLRGYLGAIARAPLSSADRASCAATTMRTVSTAALAREAMLIASRFIGARAWNGSPKRRLGPPRPA